MGSSVSFYNIYTLYRFIIELIISTALFVCFFERRKKFPLRLVLCILMCVAASTFNDRLAQFMVAKVLRYILMFVAVALSVYICFDVNLQMAFYCVVSGYTTQHFASKIYHFIFIMAPALPDYGKILISIAVVGVVYVAAFLSIARKRSAMRDMVVRRNDVVILCLLITLCMMVVTNFISYEMCVGVLAKVGYLLCGLAICIMIYALQYGIFKNAIVESQKKELERIREIERKNYEFTKETIDIINVKCHDLKHQISKLGGGGISQDEIDELKKRMDIYDLSIKTGNADLDIVIAEKSLMFEKNKIAFSVMCEAEKLNFMPSSDIYSLFGNALDNAIEAVVFLLEDERTISLGIKEIIGQLYIHIENPYVGELIRNGTALKTTKGDEAYHGFGVHSIKLTVEKFGGVLEICTDDNIFSLDILFPV